MPSAVSAIANPAGGTVTLQISGFASGAGAQMTISRAASGDSYSQIYSGIPLVSFADAGELLPTGLLSGTNYFWQVTDSVGTATVGPIQPSSYLVVEPYWMTPLLIKIIRNGIDNLPLPDNTERAEVFHDMPLNGFEPLPAITITHALFKQDAIGIGQQAPNPLAIQNDLWTMPALVENTWVMTIFAKDVQTREFYKASLISIYESSLQSVFMPMGQNVSHNFMCHDYQLTNDLKGVSPGFYCTDIMVHLTGLFNVGIQLAYPPITAIIASPTMTGTINSISFSGSFTGIVPNSGPIVS
jgi:hypothetical protein